MAKLEALAHIVGLIWNPFSKKNALFANQQLIEA